MKSFANRLDKDQRQAVAHFVDHEFITCKLRNTRYHTAEAGWPDHEKNNALAYPIVNQEVDLSAGEAGLSGPLKAGLELYREACVICHGLDIFRRAPTLGSPQEVSATSPPPDIKINDAWNGLLKPAVKPAVKPVTEPVLLAQKLHNQERPEGEHGSQNTDSYASAHDIAPFFSDLTDEQALGERLYAENCAMCHAPDGSGQNWVGSFLVPHPTNFLALDAPKRLNNERLMDAMANGMAETSMPAFKNALSHKEISAITSYIRRAFFHEWEPQEKEQGQ